MADFLDIQEQATGQGANIGGLSCATGWNQYQIFQMWMIMPVFVMVLPGFITGLVALKKMLQNKRAVKTIGKRKARRQSIGLTAAEEERQIAQIYALTSGKPIPEYKEPSPPTENTASDSESSDDDEYVTNNNITAGNVMQDGWGDHPEAVDAEKIRRANKFAEMLDMEQRAEEVARSEAARAFANAEQGTEQDRKDLKAHVDDLCANHEHILADYEARRAELGVARPETQWVEKTSKRYNQQYWKHRETGESTWTKPQEVLDAEQWETRKLELDEDIERVRAIAGDVERQLSSELSRSSSSGSWQPQPPSTFPVSRPRGTTPPPQVLQSPLSETLSDLALDDGARDTFAPQFSPDKEEDGWRKQQRKVAGQESPSPGPSPALAPLDMEPQLDDGVPLSGGSEVILDNSAISLGDMEGIDQQLNPGEYVDVCLCQDSDWVPGTVAFIEKEEDGSWRAYITLDGEDGAPQPQAYIRRPVDRPTRNDKDRKAYKKLFEADTTVVNKCISASGHDVWKGHMTWSERYAHLLQHNAQQKATMAEDSATLIELKKKILVSSDRSEIDSLSALIIAAEERLAAQKEDFTRVMPRKRWGFIQREVTDAVERKKEARLAADQKHASKAGTSSMEKLVKAESMFHLWPGTGEIRNVITGATCFVEHIDMRITSIKITVTCECPPNSSLPDLEEMYLKTDSTKITPTEVEYIENTKKFKEAIVSFDLEARLKLRQKMKICYTAKNEWNPMKVVAEDEYSGGVRPDEGIYKCTVCNSDVAIIACDLCGEEREPEVPWEDRSPPFFQPYGTNRKSEERARQVRSKASNAAKSGLSGELMCESCHRVVHAVAEKRGNRYSHIRDRHDDTMHPAMKGMKVLRKTMIRLEAPKYDVSTEAGALRLDAERGKKPVEVYIVTVLVVIFLVYPRLMTEIATLMKCDERMEATYLAADYRISCTTEKYIKWKMIAQILFLIYGLGVPFGGGAVCSLPTSQVPLPSLLNTFTTHLLPSTAPLRLRRYRRKGSPQEVDQRYARVPVLRVQTQQVCPFSPFAPSRNRTQTDTTGR